MDWMFIAKIILTVLGLLLFIWTIPALLIWQLYYSKGNRNTAKGNLPADFPVGPKEIL